MTNYKLHFLWVSKDFFLFSYKQLGASMVEYALLIALIALIAIPAVQGLSTATKNTFYNASEKVAGASGIQPTPECTGPFCG